ncbi:MAG: TrkH family potassium uptake protein [Bacillota bacterium]|nr:TrkH family potassium uptake protein [Bacillota bacterium]
MMLPSLVVAVIYREGFATMAGFVISALLCFLAGLLLAGRKPEQQNFYALEGLVFASVIWMLLSIFGSLPFLLSGHVHSFIDALFESTSGFTTTGASVLGNVEDLPHSLLFWRSFTLLIGGMGMLVFVLRFMPQFGHKGLYIMRAELPGPYSGKVESRVSSSIHLLYVIYLSMTALLVVFLAAGGVPLFDSFLLAFGAAGTGGFGIKENNLAHYASNYVQMVMATGMMVFGMNFNFFYLIAVGKWRQVRKSEELRWYLGIIAVSVALISLQLFPLYDSISRLLQDVFFTVTSVISTTAYMTVDIRSWPTFSRVVLLILMFSGAMSGSSTSGFKVARMAVFAKTIRQEIRHAINPSRNVPIQFEGHPLDKNTQRSIIYYFVCYFSVFVALLLLLSPFAKNFSGAFSAVIATLNNIGHGLDLLGPSLDYKELPQAAKLIMTIAMVMGRLEIFPVLVLFSPSTYRKT